MTSVATVWPVPTSTAGVTTTICVGLTETTKASFGVAPMPGSNNTRTGEMKFVPVMMTCSPPCGRPVEGETAVIVGVVEGGCGITGCVLNVTVVRADTLFTVALDRKS